MEQSDPMMIRDHDNHTMHVNGLYGSVQGDYKIGYLKPETVKAIVKHITNSQEVDIVNALMEWESPLFVHTPHHKKTVEAFKNNICGWELHPSKVVTDLQVEVADIFREYLISPISFVNSRAWITRPGGERFGPNSPHTDGFASGYMKVMIYPFGLDYEQGYISIADQEISDKPPGTCICFKNSDAIHYGIPGLSRPRLAIELTIMRSQLGSVQKFPSHFNGRHFKSPSFAYADIATNRKDTALDSPIRYKNVNIGSGPGVYTGPWDGWILLDEIDSSLVTNHKFTPSSYAPVPTASAPIVYSSHHFEHLDNLTLKQELREARRIITDDGSLVIKIPDYEYFLQAYRSGDVDVMTNKGIEPVICTWQAKDVKDTFENRLAMMFCGYWNTFYGDHYCGPRYLNSPRAYHGPPQLSESDLRSLFLSGSPAQISHNLANAAKEDPDFKSFNHQSAWSRNELAKIVESFGFRYIPLANKEVMSMYKDSIPDIEDLGSWSAFLLFKT